MKSGKLRVFVTDVDGTMTDGKIYMGKWGELFKVFNIRDGYGIKEILIPKGVIPVIITGRKSKILKNRCKELNVFELYQGIIDKKNCLDNILKKYNVGYENVAYIGDDINDLICISSIKSNGGITGCPADASQKIKSAVDFISEYNGGEGAVRDFIEWLFT